MLVSACVCRIIEILLHTFSIPLIMIFAKVRILLDAGMYSVYTIVQLLNNRGATGYAQDHMSEYKREDYPLGTLVKFTESNSNEFRNAVGGVIAVEGVLDKPYEEFTLLVNFPGKGRLRIHPSRVEIGASMDMISAPCELIPVTSKRKRLGDIKKG